MQKEYDPGHSIYHLFTHHKAPHWYIREMFLSMLENTLRRNQTNKLFKTNARVENAYHDLLFLLLI